MPVEVTLASAFLVGLIGSTHCIGMCGGIVGTLALGVVRAPARSRWALVPYLVAYNAGRISSYAIAGALLGLVSARVFDGIPAPAAQLAARLLSGGFMIALGLYMTGWWVGLALLERAGAKLWRHIEPAARRLLPVRHPAQALLLGALWGWLPCGMVYAALAWSLASASPLDGALLMFAFGAGTLPMLLVSGSVARWLGAVVRRPWVRRAAGMLILCFGVFTLAVSGAPGSHRHADAGASSPSRAAGAAMATNSALASPRRMRAREST